MSLLDQTARDDFAMLAIAAGLNPTDFEITAIEDPPTPGVQAMRGRVTVLRRSNGFRKSYPAGGGAFWALAVEEDLKNGAFGAPWM